VVVIVCSFVLTVIDIDDRVLPIRNADTGVMATTIIIIVIANIIDVNDRGIVDSFI